MFPNRERVTSLDGTLCAGNKTRVHTRPYLRSTSKNSCEFRSDTIYVFSEGANLRAFKSLNSIFIEYIYFIVPLSWDNRYKVPNRDSQPATHRKGDVVVVASLYSPSGKARLATDPEAIERVSTTSPSGE